MSSAFRQVEQQLRSLLDRLRTEIRAKESELGQLKEQESRLAGLLGPGRPAVAPKRRTRRRGRVNWGAVLAQMPKQFNAADVRKVRGLKGKRPSEIFAAITRWIDGGTVKRKKRGLYERV